MSAFSYQQPGMPAPRPGLVPRARRSGGAAWGYRWDRIRRNIFDSPWRAFSIIISNALGVAISIAIIAAAEGIQTKINSLLPSGSLPAVCTANSGFDPGTIQNVLDQTKGVLTNLAIISTAAIVGLVTWITISQRRRAISLEVQAGQRRWDLIVEFLGEALVLCVLGGVLGIVLGFIVCSVIERSIPLLPMNPQGSSIISIFPTTTLLAFATTAGISAYFAANTDARAKL
jgi:ABC-type antimicrobial peptide transport system permease subunit